MSLLSTTSNIHCLHTPQSPGTGVIAVNHIKYSLSPHSTVTWYRCHCCQPHQIFTVSTLHSHLVQVSLLSTTSNIHCLHTPQSPGTGVIAVNHIKYSLSPHSTVTWYRCHCCQPHQIFTVSTLHSHLVQVSLLSTTSNIHCLHTPQSPGTGVIAVNHIKYSLSPHSTVTWYRCHSCQPHQIFTVSTLHSHLVQVSLLSTTSNIHCLHTPQSPGTGVIAVNHIKYSLSPHSTVTWYRCHSCQPHQIFTVSTLHSHLVQVSLLSTTSNIHCLHTPQSPGTGVIAVNHIKYSLSPHSTVTWYRCHSCQPHQIFTVSTLHSHLVQVS